MVRTKVWVLATMLAHLVGVGDAAADKKAFRLAADAALHDSGLLDYLLPRFSLKTSIAVSVLPPGGFDPGLLTDTPTDLVALAPEGSAEARGLDPAPQVAFHEADASGGPGGAYLVIAASSGPDQPAAAFVDWLLSDIGQNTVAAYQPDGATLFLPRSVGRKPNAHEMPQGDASLGEDLALLHCGRCHVINERNRMGGIGSTPSFGALRALPEWQTRFLTFWSLNPHPSFTQVEGVTEPFDAAQPPHIAPVEITSDELDAILAYTATIAPKDLGAALEAR